MLASQGSVVKKLDTWCMTIFEDTLYFVLPKFIQRVTHEVYGLGSNLKPCTSCMTQHIVNTVIALQWYTDRVIYEVLDLATESIVVKIEVGQRPTFID